MFEAATVVGKAPFTREQGQSLGRRLIEELGKRPDACWLFCAPADGLRDLVTGAYDAAGAQNFIGCTTDGEISTTGFTTGSAVLAGIATDQISFHVASVPNISLDGERAGRELANALPKSAKHVQILSDGLTGNGSAIARGISSILGTYVPVSGGAAGDAGQFKQTFQFIRSSVLSDSVVAIAMSGDFQVGTGVKSGWFPAGVPKKVTRARGNVVYEFEGQRALDVYRMYLGPLAHKLPAVGVEFPFGIVDEALRLGEEPILRAPMAVNEQDG